MTREEAYNRIDAIIAKYEIDDEYVTITSDKDYDALRMARSSLEQEPCEDAISRQAVLDVLRTMYDTHIVETEDGDEYIDYNDTVYEVENLPSAEKTDWIPVSERLPETEQYALITVYNETKMCWYQNGVFVDGEQNAYIKESEELIAWMPLPEVYREEGSGE